ncbi:MAG: GvpL/GvpF family gas vesicle protein [Solirubrobacteraceae bacterium]
MAGSGDSQRRLRAAIDDLAAADAADVLDEARIEARARVRATLTDALANAMLEHLQAQLDAPDRAGAAAPLEAGAGRAWYVYGVVAAGTELGDQLRDVDPERPLDLLREGPVAAVMHPVALAEYDEERLREHLADLGWVEATARAHQEVLGRIQEHATVIPMRMCTVYKTEDGVREMLSRESEPLRDAIDRLDGRAEWAVKVFARSVPAASTPGDASGAAYMERLRTEAVQREHSRTAADEEATRLHERLSALAGDARIIPLQRPEVSGHGGEMILNGVYLVADDDALAFGEQVAALRSELKGDGYELALTGPWPAYNFVPGTIGAAW